MKFLHPILTCAESATLEHQLLGDDEDAAWQAMHRAGSRLGCAIHQYSQEPGPAAGNTRLLVLCGKGHNAGDALVAARELLTLPGLTEITVVFAFGTEPSRPLVQRALRFLREDAGGRLRVINYEQRLSGNIEATTSLLQGGHAQPFDIVIDGILGMQGRPPLREPVATLVRAVNELDIPFRAAVDLPSGLSDEPAEEAFRADFSFATGIAKTPLFLERNAQWAGRIHYLDIGFFDQPYEGAHSSRAFIINQSVLEPLRRLRPPHSDKRDYGHVLICAGSRAMPGALMLNAHAAVQAGAGLTTALAPQSVQPAFAAQLPEVMWAPFPETPDGGLAPEGLCLVRQYIARASCLLMGSGMGSETATQRLITDAVAEAGERPLVLDADALTPQLAAAVKARQGNGPVFFTPHAGEFKRLSGGSQPTGDNLRAFCRAHRATVILKGPVTTVCDGHFTARNVFGGPALARGGTGDILAGMLASLAARESCPALETACRAVLWHARAGESAARNLGGQSAMRTTELLAFLGTALER